MNCGKSKKKLLPFPEIQNSILIPCRMNSSKSQSESTESILNHSWFIEGVKLGKDTYRTMISPQNLLLPVPRR